MSIRTCLPVGVAHTTSPVERAGARSRRPLVLEHRRPPELERLVVHVQPDDLAVGDVDDRLPGGGEAVGPLAIGDRPGLVEAVDERPVLVGRGPFLEPPRMPR